MSFRTIQGTAAGLLMLSAGSVAQAASIATTMTVTATAQETCSISASPLAFGNLSAATFTEQLGSLSVTCDSGVAYSVTIDAGQYVGQASPGGGFCPSNKRCLFDGNGQYVAYDLYYDSYFGSAWGDQGFGGTFNAGIARTGTGSGSEQTLNVYGVAQAHPGAGNYSDQVVVTIHY